MTERERLIELINQYPCMSTAEDCFMESISADLADYLLANGVIVPPCKVGQKVYYVIESLEEIVEGRIREIIVAEGIFINFTLKGWFSQTSHIGEIGKTVFLTKEEAEQALGGGEE